MSVLDLRIDLTADALLNLAKAEAEDPSDIAMSQAVNVLAEQLNDLVQLRLGVKALPR